MVRKLLCLLVIVAMAPAFVGFSCVFEGCLQFEGLVVGTQYNVGDSFVVSGVTVNVLPFEWSNGTLTSNGYAEVTDAGYAGVSGKEIHVNNVNLAFNLGGIVEKLHLNFGEYGGNLNIEVGGDFRNFDNFDELDNTTVGGVPVTVVNGHGNDAGRLLLSGEFGKFTSAKLHVTTWFVVGGQELWIDQVCVYRP